MPELPYAQEDAVLRFEIAPGASPDAEVVAQAIIAWVELVKSAIVLVDPDGDPRIELVAVEPGSQMFVLAIRRLKDGASEYPLVAKAAGALATAITSTMVTIALTPDTRIPDDQMAVFNEMNKNIAASLEVQRRRHEFYTIIYPEKSITAVEIRDGYTRIPLYRAPRNTFAEGSGLFSEQIPEDPQPTEDRVAIWDVVVVRPALIAKPRRWTFARDGLEFTALMNDPAVFAAMKARTLDIPFAEGVHLKVRIAYKERKVGGLWWVIPESRKVTEVLDPLPPAPSTPMFPTAGDPKESDEG